jgi:hypothetical protein
VILILMRSKFKFVIWKRNDGYIGATAGYLPADYTGANGEVNTFEKLFETDDWGVAYDYMHDNRRSQ